MPFGTGLKTAFDGSQDLQRNLVASFHLRSSLSGAIYGIVNKGRGSPDFRIWVGQEVVVQGH